MSINDAFPNCKTGLKIEVTLRNVNRVIISNLNISSLPNNFDQLKEIVLVITEIKVDDTFISKSRILVSGFFVP